LEAPAAARGTVQAAHTPQHFRRVERAVSEGIGYLDADTIVSMRSLDAALHAAGGACRAVDAVMQGEARNAFLPARPPGHHATEQRRMFDVALAEISANFKPDLIIISAGFDAHLHDPLGQLRLEDEDFIRMTRTVKAWAAEACAGRIVSCLEGGYNLQTLGAT